MITAIIVDDEQHCINNLKSLLAEYCSDAVELKGSFQSVEEGLRAIELIQPQLVFLDVKIKDQTGFDLLRLLSDINFEVIFTTAHDEYAVQAFRFSAIDYLMKPVKAQQLVTTVNKLSSRFSKEEITRKFSVLVHNLKKNTSKKIGLPVLTGLIFLNAEDIIRCEGSDNYTNIFTSDKKPQLVSRTLKEIEALLSDCNFFRVHHSHLINLNRIKSYNKGRGGFVIMEDGSDVEVSTRKKDDFIKRISVL